MDAKIEFSIVKRKENRGKVINKKSQKLLRKWELLTYKV